MLLECQKAQKGGVVPAFCQKFEQEGEDFLSRIVTADETWISLYELESKEQSTMCKNPGSPSPKKRSITLAMAKCLWFSVKKRVCQSTLSSH